ncbi:MAG: hypothetical protein MUC66_03810 [Methanolinea sp.]|nr:hypothetical protein [Methanolinea sp.]
MQLPRGTFRSMKKGTRVDMLLKSLQEEVFSGYCSLLCKDQSITLVLERGNVVLASCGAARGDAAIEKILLLQQEVADASLSDLTDTQLKLTREFNAACKVTRQPGDRKKTALPPRIKERGTPTPPNPPEMVSEGLFMEDMHSMPTPASPSEMRPSGKKIETPPIVNASELQKEPEMPGEGDMCSLVDRDLNALAAMDLESMSEKIRLNYKIMIEKLHLEHLIEKRGE